jgi:hypothetical protein
MIEASWRSISYQDPELDSTAGVIRSKRTRALVPNPGKPDGIEDRTRNFGP